MTHDEMLQELTNRTPKSGKLWEASQGLVPGGLLSQARRFKPYPFYAERAEGQYIWDIDGNRYLDCTMSFGVHVLGHCPPPVVEAMLTQAKRGTSFGAPHTHEIEYTRRLIECIPCAEMAMLCNTGTEATMVGVRLMRASTVERLRRSEQHGAGGCTEAGAGVGRHPGRGERHGQDTPGQREGLRHHRGARR
jgi:glutamate-1-semialdehyde 2,1-aminomutase